MDHAEQLERDREARLDEAERQPIVRFRTFADRLSTWKFPARPLVAPLGGIGPGAGDNARVRATKREEARVRAQRSHTHVA